MTYASVLDLLRFIRRGFGDGAADERLDALSQVDVLILDNLGAENLTAWASEQLFVLLNARDLADRPTVLISNDLPGLGGSSGQPGLGGRKIRRVLQDQGHSDVPAASTITAILRRNQQIDPDESLKPLQRFERVQLNELWQMDFKGYFALEAGGYCHPLTVIDDHSRFLVGLKACPDETYETVQRQLTAIFQQFGLPQQMLMDNGSPWGDDRVSHHTILTTWLLRLEIAVSHGRPYHPQTQGKDERLNRTLKDEVIRRHVMNDLAESQVIFDQWWYKYNYERPHEALQLDIPAKHHHQSARPFPDGLPPITYEPEDIVRKVDQSGKVYFQNQVFRVGKAFRYQPVALRPTQEDGVFHVFFCKQKVARINLRVDNQC